MNTNIITTNINTMDHNNIQKMDKNNKTDKDNKKR